MSVLKCHMDESSDKDSKTLFVVGAVIGTGEKWDFLKTKWKEALDRDGIKYFRSNDCAALTGQFLKFRKNKHKVTPAERRKAESIRHQLLEIIKASRLTGIGIAIDMAAFRAVTSTPEKLEALGGTPYYHCYYLTMARCALLVKKHLPSDSLAFGYDEHQRYGLHLENVYNDFKKLNPGIAPYMAKIARFDDKVFIPVQVADLV